MHVSLEINRCNGMQKDREEIIYRWYEKREERWKWEGKEQVNTKERPTERKGTSEGLQGQ